MPKYKDDDGILNPRLQYAIEHYIDSRDVGKAAILAGMDPDELRRFMRHADVKAIIQKKIDAIDVAMAEVRAKARILTADKLDAALVDVLEMSGEKTVRSRVKAIEIGYKRHGMLKEKYEHTGENGAPLAFELVRIGAKKDPDDSE